jgi:hypothetical protein
MSLSQAPTYADLMLIDPHTKKPTFNPIWLDWFLMLAQSQNANVVTRLAVSGDPFVSGDVTLAPGTNVSMTEVGSLITITANVAGLLASAGGLVASTVIPATITDTTGGITLAGQVAAVGSVWRVRAMGTFIAALAITARNALITPYWGAVALPVITVGAVLASTAQTTNWSCEFDIVGSSTTTLQTAGQCLNSVASATLLALAGAASASKTVTAGAQTLDLCFAMSAAVVGDQWIVQQVTMERIK